MRRVGNQHQRRLRSYGFSFGEERRRIVGARSPYFGLPQSNQVEVATILCLHDTLRVVCECVGVHSYKKLSVRDYEWESVNTKLWERLCEIVESSNTLKTLAVKYYKEAPTDVPLAILFYHLKSRRSSLDRLVLDIFRHDQYQTLMLDVRYFIEHHPTSILDVRCVISTQLHIQNVRALLEGLNLNKLDWDNVIGNAIDYEPIADWSGIKSVKKLSMNRVRYQFEVSSVANLLRNHDVPVKELVIQGELPMGPDGCAEMIRELADSLRGNTSVRTLFLSLHCPNLDAMENELLEKRLGHALASYYVILPVLTALSGQIIHWFRSRFIIIDTDMQSGRISTVYETREWLSDERYSSFTSMGNSVLFHSKTWLSRFCH